LEGVERWHREKGEGRGRADLWAFVSGRAVIDTGCEPVHFGYFFCED